LSSDFTNSLTDDAVVADRQRGRAADKTGRAADLIAALGPIAVAMAAIAAETFIPNKQFAPSSRPLLVLLGGLLATVVVLALLQLTRSKLAAWARHYGPLLGGACLLLTVWDLVTVKLSLLPLPYFPGPQRVLQSLHDDRKLLALSTWSSLRLLLSGYALGAIVGVACGILVGWFRNVRYWGMPLLKLIGPIPATAYVPLVMVLFANQFLSGTALIAMAVWFPVTMLTSSGIANVPVAYLDVARTLGAGRGYLIFRVALPAALPNIFLGLFMGLGSAFLTLIVAETLGVSSGLGWYLKWQQGYLEYANVYAALIIMSVFFSGLMTVLFRIRDRLLSWQKGVIRW
jgi:NitT/TauT family transport system permease protein